jgi:hypothetical protein
VITQSVEAILNQTEAPPVMLEFVGLAVAEAAILAQTISAGTLAAAIPAAAAAAGVVGLITITDQIQRGQVATVELTPAAAAAAVVPA